MKFNRLTVLWAMVSMAALVAGCKDEPEITPALPVVQSGGASVSPAAQADVVAPPPVASAASSSMPGAAISEAPPEVLSKDALEAVTMATQSFFIAHERAPKSLEELVSTGLLRKLPVPPVGKKYVYDAEHAKISLADQ